MREFTFAGVPAPARRVLFRHYRIDQDHGNSYTVWKALGSPQRPTPEQYARLEAAGQLQFLTSPYWTDVAKSAVELGFSLPRQGVSLVEVSW
jgi:xylan 1,4-beta-xylosidase